MTLEQQAVADQVRTLRREADDFFVAASGDDVPVDDAIELMFKALELQNCADRLEQRAQEAVNASL